MNANKIYVPVLVNKTGPYWFMLDTGSWSDAVDTETAKSLGIAVKDPFEAHGAGEKPITGAIGSNVSLEFAGIELLQPEIDVEPVNAAISAAEGRRVDGLLGYDFFSRFVVQIDYAHRQVQVLEPAAFHYTGTGESIPLKVIRGNIFIATYLTMPNGRRVPGSFLVDTGWRSALTLTAPFVTSQKLGMMAPKMVDATTGVGIGGPTVDTVARIPSLKLGRYTIENFVANFSHAKAGVLSQSDFAGIIGAEILRRFTVTFDYPHQRMILEPNPMSATPYEFDMSGLFITAEAGSFAVFTVRDVIKDSPAMQAGIRGGDVIAAIDGRPASSFTLEQIRQLFKESEGQEHSLSVRRDNRVLAVKFRLHRII
ncbi:MAG TPA: aspartyl protease family protein [Terracidiphilus sp.]|nr:aspartyl protease family protein [Terracidiphilus sp.]